MLLKIADSFFSNEQILLETVKSAAFFERFSPLFDLLDVKNCKNRIVPVIAPRHDPLLLDPIIQTLPCYAKNFGRTTQAILPVFLACYLFALFFWRAYFFFSRPLGIHPAENIDAPLKGNSGFFNFLFVQPLLFSQSICKSFPGIIITCA